MPRTPSPTSHTPSPTPATLASTALASEPRAPSPEPRAPPPRDPTRACNGAAVGGVFAVLACFVGYLEQRGYGLGIVEAIATTIFIGFACDYCCHVAQARSSVSLSLSRSRSRNLRLEPTLSPP